MILNVPLLRNVAKYFLFLTCLIVFQDAWHWPMTWIWKSTSWERWELVPYKKCGKTLIQFIETEGFFYCAFLSVAARIKGEPFNLLTPFGQIFLSNFLFSIWSHYFFAILGRPLWGRHQGHLHWGRSSRPQGAEDEGQPFFNHLYAFIESRNFNNRPNALVWMSHHGSFPRILWK